MIPPILHRIWTEAEFPAAFQAWDKTWQRLHPEFETILWTRPRIVEYMRQQTPNVQFFFERLKFDIQRWDFFRLIILHDFGGIYSDWDVELLNPLTPLMTGKLLLTYCKRDSSRVCIGTMGSEPGHSFWCQALYMLMQQYDQRMAMQQEYSQQIVFTTGPAFFTAAVHRYLEPSVPWPSALFFPFEHHEKETRRNEEFPNAFAKHHWSGSWSFEPVVPRQNV